jgi:LysR family hydrogen peroxide-inducible transcriptional activator
LSWGIKDIVDQQKGYIGGEFKVGIIPTVMPTLLPMFLNNFIKFNDFELFLPRSVDIL